MRGKQSARLARAWDRLVFGGVGTPVRLGPVAHGNAGRVAGRNGGHPLLRRAHPRPAELMARSGLTAHHGPRAESTQLPNGFAEIVG